MCGIAGILGVDAVRAVPMVERMVQALHHRGPDSHRVEEIARGGHSPAVLGFARLRIIDLSPRADQPMHLSGRASGPGTAIVFNGEIYNFRELRRELVELGHTFDSSSDTEVILHAHQQWGIEAVQRICGMFAWAIVDSASASVWLCRDRLGIKPLYVARPISGGLFFASEVRALLAAQHPEILPRVNPVALESYLAQGATYGLESLIDGIELLGPGESLEVDWNGVQHRRRTYWGLRFAEPEASRDTAVARMGSILRDVVQQHLISDVPLGLFLSGGIDSSAIAALATERSNGRIRSICVGFDQPEFDETREAERVAKLLGTDHQNLRLDGQALATSVADVFTAADQPTVDGFNTYFVSRATRQAGLTVALSGLGGDELFGGYATFRDLPRAIRMSSIARGLGPLRLVLANRASQLARSRSALKLLELLRRSGLASMYLLRRELFLPEERRALLPLPGGSDRVSGIPDEELRLLDAIAGAPDELNAISALEVSGYLRNMLLRDGDCFSMAVSLELRVPILDHRVVEAAMAMPGGWKRRDLRAKPLLQDAVGERMRALRLRRRKRGFTFPWERWLLGPLAPAVEAAVRAADTWKALGISASAPIEFWTRFRNGDARVTALHIVALWMLAEYSSRNRLSR